MGSLGSVEHDTSTRTRILEAAVEVMSRSGQSKLSLSDVAVQARVSRPTLYRWFASKDELLTAVGVYEQRKFDEGISSATAGLDGIERLDAALKFIVDFQHSHSLGRMIEVEPAHVVAQMGQVLPVMRERLERLLPGKNGAVAAATAIRVAASHYMVTSDDKDQLLAQLRHAVGIEGAPPANPARPANPASPARIRKPTRRRSGM
jgi:AcrR family transcriptional regulator